MKYLWLLIIFIVSGCAHITPSDLPYEAVVPGISISQIDSNLTAPSRMKFTPDGMYLFVAELGGTIQVYKRDAAAFVRQPSLYDLNLTVEGERGLTGLFLAENFTLDGSPEQREIFVSYQTLENATYINKLERLSLDSSLHVVAAEIIYVSPESAVSAHQIQDGVEFTYEGKLHILFSIGDCWQSDNASDPTREGIGKFLLLQRTGENPLGERPYPESPKVQAVGIRNVYGLAMLPENIDSRRRFFGVENGESHIDRMWLLELVDFGHEVDASQNLGWNGEDQSVQWKSVLDKNTPGVIKPEGVVATMSPVVSPTSVAVHPGKGIIPPASLNQANVVVVYFGPTGSMNATPGKEIVWGRLSNLGNQPALKLIPIIRRKDDGQLGQPVAMDVDPRSKDIFFADIMTGVIYRATLT